MCICVTFIYECGHKLLVRTSCKDKNLLLCDDLLNERRDREGECCCCIERITEVGLDGDLDAFPPEMVDQVMETIDAQQWANPTSPSSPPDDLEDGELYDVSGPRASKSSKYSFANKLERSRSYRAGSSSRSRSKSRSPVKERERSASSNAYRSDIYEHEEHVPRSKIRHRIGGKARRIKTEEDAIAYNDEDYEDEDTSNVGATLGDAFAVEGGDAGMTGTDIELQRRYSEMRMSEEELDEGMGYTIDSAMRSIFGGALPIPRPEHSIMEREIELAEREGETDLDDASLEDLHEAAMLHEAAVGGGDKGQLTAEELERVRLWIEAHPAGGAEELEQEMRTW